MRESARKAVASSVRVGIGDRVGDAGAVGSAAVMGRR
jgi:hypothetical protein